MAGPGNLLLRDRNGRSTHPPTSPHFLRQSPEALLARLSVQNMIGKRADVLGYELMSLPGYIITLPG